MTSNGKISLRQAMILFLVISFTPAVRMVPSTIAGVAKQAAWLTPVVSFVIVLPVIFALKSILNKYPDKSFTEILEVIFGRFLGKIMTFAYIVSYIITIDLNVNDISRKLVGSLYPTVDPAVFIIVMLVAIGLAVYRGGITVITRMGEFMFPFLVVIFVLLCSLATPNIKLSRLTPISYLDLVPILRSSLPLCAVQAHLPMMFLLSNYFNNKEKIGKYCISAALLYTFLVAVLIVTVIGSLGAETTANTPMAFMTSVRLISLFESIERIEPLVVALWIFTDFILVSVLLISLLNMYRSLFNLSKTENLIIISLIVIFFMAMVLGRNIFEIQRFGQVFILPITSFWGYVLPLVVFISGKVRKLL